MNDKYARRKQMRKIPTLLVRNPEDRAHVLDEVTPGCEWVLAGEGIPTRKYDGTCVMLEVDRRWWARREVKPGKTYPANYVVDNLDDVTGKTQGWEPIEQSPFAKFHAEALLGHTFRPATYELVGPKINGNPEGFDKHELIGHDGAELVISLDRELDLGSLLFIFGNVMRETGWEGVVWHHPDGRMAKLKARDLS